MEELGTRVRDRRAAMALGIREAASQADMTPTTFARIEGGKMPDLENFKRICDWLGIDPNEILSGKKTPSSNLSFSDATGQVFAHFRARRVIDPNTSNHLAKLIQAINQEL